MPTADGPVDLGDALVVAVQAEPRRVDPGGERDGELAAAAHVDVEAGLGHPAGDLGAQERLAGVVHAAAVLPTRANSRVERLADAPWRATRASASSTT